MAKRDSRRSDRRRRHRIRQAVFAGVVLVVLSAAIFFLGRAFDRPELPPIAGNVIDIAADMGGFDMTEIRVPAGEPVTMRLTSRDTSAHTDGGGKHQWAVDELGVSIIAPPLGSAYATFTPSQPGQYTFYCDVCCGGRANPTMQGTLIVEV